MECEQLRYIRLLHCGLDTESTVIMYEHSEMYASQNIGTVMDTYLCNTERSSIPFQGVQLRLSATPCLVNPHILRPIMINNRLNLEKIS